jgi:hypothetical protein
VNPGPPRIETNIALRWQYLATSSLAVTVTVDRGYYSDKIRTAQSSPGFTGETARKGVPLPSRPAGDGWPSAVMRGRTALRQASASGGAAPGGAAVSSASTRPSTTMAPARVPGRQCHLADDGIAAMAGKYQISHHMPELKEVVRTGVARS